MHSCCRARLLAVPVLVGCLVLLQACPRPDRYQLGGLKSEQAFSRVNNVAQRHERLEGTLTAKLPGLQGMVASVTLDVALEPEGKVNVAVRSFFEQPMQVLATDGQTVTLFDATAGAPVFRRGVVNAYTLARVLPLPMWPQELVAIMLARLPNGARGRLLAVDEDKETYTLAVEAPGIGPAALTVRASDDAILVWRAFRRDGAPLLECRYSDFRPIGGADIQAAHAWELERLDTNAHEAIHVSAQDIRYNAAPLPSDAFLLTPPPGTAVLPFDEAG